MRKPFFLVLLLFSLISCQTKSQQKLPMAESRPPTALVGGGCDGCERMYYEMPTFINSTDTSFGWPEARTKLMVTGTVYRSDGRTPAPDVIVYYWQTDERGFYANSQASGLANTRHGSRRGWMRTGADGQYTLYTNRPAAYPDRDIPAHIHLAIKEPDIADEYYVDELVFDDDALLTTTKRKALENRGGSGVMRPAVKNGIQIARHDIILGLHIPNHPGNASGSRQSGLSIGEESPSFTPYHAWGADRGSKACPVCKYGRNYGILYFAGKSEVPANRDLWLKYLEKLSQEKQEVLKVYFITETRDDPDSTKAKLERMGEELGIRRLALTMVPDFGDAVSEVHLNRIDPAAGNTFVVYRNRTIIDKYTNLSPTKGNFEKLVSKVSPMPDR